MGTIIGDFLGTTIGIHSPIPTKNQTVFGAGSPYILT